MALQALLFDLDGTLADTERLGHRPAYNRAFRKLGLPFRWGPKLYRRLLKKPGGQERLLHYLDRYQPELGEQAPVAEVRRRICAWPVTTEDVTRWPTLLRWARAARGALRDSRLSLRDAASRAAQIAIGHAPPSLRTAPQCHQAFAGGSAMR